jgi:hypothetical protein
MVGGCSYVDYLLYLWFCAIGGWNCRLHRLELSVREVQIGDLMKLCDEDGMKLAGDTVQTRHRDDSGQEVL